MAAKKELLKWDAQVPVDLDQQKRLKGVGGAGVDQMTREVINSLFPPIEFTENDTKFTQAVSISTVTRSDVQKLRTQLTTLLQVRAAKSVGICRIRSEIYSQCFDEIVRQVAVDSNARGRLLARVRDHYRGLVRAYKELYETTLDWGHRKQMQVDLGVPDLKIYSEERKAERRKLELRANDLQIRLDALEKKLAENKALREKDRADEIAFLKRQGQMTKAQIDMYNTQNPK
jgi:dynein light intermediate chain